MNNHEYPRFLETRFAYDFADATHFLANLEDELEARNPGATSLIRQHGVSLTELGATLREHVPNMISKRLEPSASQGWWMNVL